MATTKTQRIGIWIIAVFMAVGTIGSFAIIVLANSNSQADTARYNELYAQYQKEQTAYTEKTDAQAKELSDKYYATFSQYASRPSTFDKNGVSELKTEDLVVGTGEDLTEESTFTAYYIGWTPDGNIFDQSISDGALKAPFTAAPGQVIRGWTKGVAGMKVGGVRELTIPSDLAYGETGSGDSIPANTPLKFVIMTIPTPTAIEQPMPSEEITTLYSRLYGN